MQLQLFAEPTKLDHIWFAEEDTTEDIDIITELLIELGQLIIIEPITEHIIMEHTITEHIIMEHIITVHIIMEHIITEHIM